MADERLLNHADVEQIATLLEQSAKLTPGVNDGAINKLPSHADGTRLGTAIGELKNTGAFTAQYEFDTVSEMNTAIQAGTVKEGATIFVKEGSGSESGGHTIQNPSGTSMTQRTNLKFVGASVTDDSTNDATVVTVPDGGHDIIDGSGTEMTKRSGLQFVGASVTDDGTNDVTVVEVPSDAGDIAYGSGTVADKLDKIQTESLTFYVDATNGSDSNDGLTAATAFATIQKAVDSCPDNSTNALTTTIRIASGTYNEQVLVQGKRVYLRQPSGDSGTIFINGGIKGIYFSNIIIDAGSLTINTDSTHTNAIHVESNSYLEITARGTLTLNGYSTKLGIGILSGSGSTAQIYHNNIIFNNLEFCICVDWNGNAYCLNNNTWTIINCSYQFITRGGRIIVHATPVSGADVLKVADNGGRIFIGTQPVIETTPTNNANNIPSSSWAYNLIQVTSTDPGEGAAFTGKLLVVVEE